MRINANGLHWTTVGLADGTKKIYWYAWRGGPRLVGDYGSPEFIASYNAAIATKVAAPEGRLLSLLQGYQTSQDFLSLRDRTRADYIKQIAKIEHRFGDAPLKALSHPRTRGVFLDWRDELALKSKRQADYAWTVLARVLSWAKDRGKITVNPCDRGGRVYHGTRVDFVWSVDDEAAFLEHAPAHLHLPLCSRCGPASGKAISCASRGRPTTVRPSGCGSRRPTRVWSFRSPRRSRPRSTLRRSADRSF